MPTDVKNVSLSIIMGLNQIGHYCPIIWHICPNLGLVFNINVLLPKIYHFLRLSVAKLPHFTKKSPQNWRPSFPQVASAPTNPVFRADGMTFEAKDWQGGNEVLAVSS